MHKPESVIENETHKILRDFEIQTVHPVPARKQDLFPYKKKISHLLDFFIPVSYRVKIKESKTIDKDLDIVRELKKH